MEQKALCRGKYICLQGYMARLGPLSQKIRNKTSIYLIVVYDGYPYRHGKIPFRFK